ncbi:Arrestin domain-containing protein 2 [Folsomia candida]|uniref:Arrestin domain-containing protein 2 n=1 Tax=Folsomia candida TaxID=158441 RepID=A0A226D763_FOLCA|nr:Arrestin domain-containing protein 2 [Folsomia candida]
MDYIREFDIRLEKEMYYAGETLSGVVILDTVENFKLRRIQVVVRGKAHTEWKVMVSGERRTVKDDQYFIDDRSTIWGKGETDATVDIPYASPPQGMKYFTIIGPWIDCMDYLKPMVGDRKRPRFSLCWDRRWVNIRTHLERSAYVCGESLRLKAEIDNQSGEDARLKLRLVQYVEYYIDRGVLGVSKELSNTILEYRGAPVVPRSRIKWDSHQNIVVPVMPPTLLGVCRLIQIYYVLKVSVELEKSGEDLQMHFPITIATVPFRIPNSTQQPAIQYDVASEIAEGGMYIGPEFQLGQVYDGSVENGDSVVLYRPVYVSVTSQGNGTRSRSETPTGVGRNAIEKDGGASNMIINNKNNTNTTIVGGAGSAATNSKTNASSAATNLIKGSKVSDTGGGAPRTQRKLESSNSVTSEKDTLLKETIKGI